MQLATSINGGRWLLKLKKNAFSSYYGSPALQFELMGAATFSIMSLFMTLSIPVYNDIMLNVTMLSRFSYCYAECRGADLMGLIKNTCKNDDSPFSSPARTCA